MSARDLWLMQFRKVHSDPRADEHGHCRIDILDFEQAFDGTPVKKPDSVSKYGWLVYTGGPNDPLVGSEDNVHLALARAWAVRTSLVRAIALPDPNQAVTCNGCGAEVQEYEPCPMCGVPTCDSCFLDKGGCGSAGCPSANQGDPDIARGARAPVLTDLYSEATQRVRDHDPMGEISQTPGDIQEETARLQRAADALLSVDDAQ